MTFRAFDRWRAFDAFMVPSRAGDVTTVFDWLASTGTLDASMSVARTVAAYGRGSDGYWDSYSANTARFDYTDGVNQFLLIEPEKTNSLIYSRAFSSWGDLGATVAVNATGFDGATSASTLTDSDGANVSSRRIDTTITPNTNQNAVKILLKKNASPTVYPSISFQHRGGTAQTAGQVIVNPSTGVLTLVSGNSDNFVVEDAGDFWKISWNGTNNGTNTTIRCQVYPAFSTDGSTLNVSATGSCVVDQCEIILNSTKEVAAASSPITTSGTAQTRTADTLTVAGLPAENEARITLADDSTIDIDDWDGTRTPTGVERIKRITVYPPGGRP